jgi:hypothetical protein
MKRVEKQGELLLKVYLAERAKDPSSLATESSRGNVIALPHTIMQTYDESEVSRLLLSTCSFPRLSESQSWEPYPTSVLDLRVVRP